MNSEFAALCDITGVQNTRGRSTQWRVVRGSVYHGMSWLTPYSPPHVASSWEGCSWLHLNPGMSLFFRLLPSFGHRRRHRRPEGDPSTPRSSFPKHQPPRAFGPGGPAGHFTFVRRCLVLPVSTRRECSGRSECALADEGDATLNHEDEEEDEDDVATQDTAQPRMEEPRVHF